MSEFSFYSVSRPHYLKPTSHAMWKVGNIICLGTSADNTNEYWMTVNISKQVIPDTNLPPFAEGDDARRVSQETFNKYFNKTFDFLQKLRFHDGEYYVDRRHDGTTITLHAFLRQPSRYYEIEYRQEVDSVEISISTENSIVYRRGCANHCRILSEGIFCQAFKLILEFFYDGSAMQTNQGKLWDTIDALTSSKELEDPVLINDEYYYLRARELMLKRKEEIKLRLLELDDIPSKRRELRAEMKGIDYCVSILDKNH